LRTGIEEKTTFALIDGGELSPTGLITGSKPGQGFTLEERAKPNLF